MADNQAPQRAIDQDGHDQRRGHAHVGQVFGVHHRRTAQRAMRHVQRFAGVRVGQRHQLHQRAGSILKRTNPKPAENLTGGLRNIGRRIVQAQPAGQVVPFALGKHLAMLVGMKTVHHDPVQPGHAAYFRGHSFAKSAQAGGRLQAANSSLDQGKVISLGLSFLPPGGLEFQHHHAVQGVNANVKCRLAFESFNCEGVKHVALQRFALQHVLQTSQPFRTNDTGNALAKQRCKGHTEKLLRVVAALQNRQVSQAQHQQGAVGLDTSRRLDGFTVAGGQAGAVADDAVKAIVPGQRGGICGGVVHGVPLSGVG